MTNALEVYKDIDKLERAAIALYKSGYFPDAKSQAQAMVKVMAGAEVGIPPFASMSGINVIQGKPGFGSNLIATLVDNHPRYNYKLKRSDDKACVIEWYKDGELQGESQFTIEEARGIKQWNSKKNSFEPLTNKLNWQNYPSDMLFARAMTRGQKRYAAGVAGGAPLYTAEELGADEDEHGNVVIIDELGYEADDEKNAPILDELGFEPEDAPVAHYNFSKRPYDAPTLKAALAKKVEKIGTYDASEKQRNLLGALLSEYFQDDTKRYECSEYLFGARSTKDIDGAMVKAALDWLAPSKDDGGAYAIDNTAKTELGHAHTAALEASGQTALL